MNNSFFGKIFNAFPPPKFLNIPFAGVAISDSAIRVIQFGRKGGRLYIQKYTEKPIASGVITSGQINNTEEVVKILVDVKKELNLEHVKISLPEERAYLFTTKLPVVSQKELHSALESKMEENVPVAPTDINFDYKLFYHKQKEHLDVSVAAVPSDLINQYVDIANKAGLALLSLEIEPQAIIRSLVPVGSANTVLVIHFSPGKVSLYVSTYRVVRFTSTISTKFVQKDDPSFLLREVKRLDIYWDTLKENVDKADRKISQIIICGEGFDDSMISYLSSHLSTPITMGNVWTNVFDINSVLPEMSFSDSLRFPSATGLALPEDTLI